MPYDVYTFSFLCFKTSTATIGSPKSSKVFGKKQEMTEILQSIAGKKSEKYVFDVKLFLALCQYDNDNFSYRILILL